MRCLVIGGGASGMLAAIMAAKAGAAVTILEHNDRLGRKLQATGNGKCNLTNLEQSLSQYRGGSREKIAQAFSCFSLADTLKTFEELGLMYQDKNGYVYPMSEQAASVVSLLVCNLRKYKVQVITECEVTGIRKTKQGFTVFGTIRQEETSFSADRVIIACGGLAGKNLGASDTGYKLARQMGHHVTALYPALVQLCTAKPLLKAASGVRLAAGLQLVCEDGRSVQEQGELVITDYGISGIPAMQVSRFAAEWIGEGKKVTAKVNFLPKLTSARLHNMLAHLLMPPCGEGKTAAEALQTLLPWKLLQVLGKQAGIPLEASAVSLQKKELTKLEKQIAEYSLAISGTQDFQNAQTTAGGVRLNEVHMDTMESMLVPGLYLTGEVLDVDGNCGGYNLQWAWTTGAIAGSHAGRRDA